MAEEDRGDKTEEASPRKREDARKRGMIAQSPDLNHALVLVASLLALATLGSGIITSQLTFMKGWFAQIDGHTPLTDFLTQRAPAAMLPVFLATVAVIGMITLAALASGILQAGIHFNPDLISAKWERVDPLQGLSRLFSLTSLVSTVLGILKLVALSWAAYALLSTVFVNAPSFWQLSAPALLSLAGDLSMKLGWSIALPMLVVGGVDYVYRKWKHEKDLMMSRDELREENKQQEGDPHIRQRIRQIQRQRAMRRMMQDVPKATVVITNPTHVAVALRYEAGASAAPVVIAKGEHIIAGRIKAIAAEHGVPVIEEPPLARALLKSVHIGQEISVEFYRAVAEVLAVLHRQKTGAVQGVLPQGKNVAPGVRL